MREDGHNERDTCSRVVTSVFREEPAAASAHMSSLGHMATFPGLSMLYALVLLYCLVLWVLDCPGQPQRCSEAEDDCVSDPSTSTSHARIGHSAFQCAGACRLGLPGQV